MHIKVDDMVEVISGEDRGVQGKVLRVFESEKKVLVEGVNRVYKHVRPNRRNPQGGRLSKEMPIWLSNVKLICTQCNQAARTGARYLEDGSKERYCKKCDAGLGQLAPPKAAYAQAKK